MTTKLVARPTVELRHRDGCPAADGRLYGNPSAEDLALAAKGQSTIPRKAIGIEAYVVTGVGRYNRTTGEFESIPRAGVVRCIECAEQAIVTPEQVSIYRNLIAAQGAGEVVTNA